MADRLLLVHSELVSLKEFLPPERRSMFLR